MLLFDFHLIWPCQMFYAPALSYLGQASILDRRREGIVPVEGGPFFLPAFPIACTRC
jgi:hypothetical protein